MNLQRMSFSGKSLERGFWVYVWRVGFAGDEVLYVGRTGDSSSTNAASPFARIGQHLAAKPTARANALRRRLREREINPEASVFEMVAVGPIYPECSEKAHHERCRDATGALERALGEWLAKRGYDVLSIDRTKAAVDPELLAQVLRYFKPEFPDCAIR